MLLLKQAKVVVTLLQPSIKTRFTEVGFLADSVLCQGLSKQQLKKRVWDRPPFDKSHDFFCGVLSNTHWDLYLGTTQIYH